MIRNGLHHFVKHVRDRLASVIFLGSMVKLCDFICSIFGQNGNFRNIFYLQHGIHCCLIGIQNSLYKLLTVLIAAVFCSQYIFVVILSHLDK